MNYNHAVAFAVFADHLNFTHAARTLHVTQPALHAQIRKLSETLGTALYVRRGRRLVLTAAGRELAIFGRQLKARGDDLVADLTGASRRRAPVVLVSGQGAYLHLLGPAIKRYCRSGRSLRALTMDGPSALAAVDEARADVAVTVAGPDALPDDRIGRLRRRPLRDVGQQLVVPKGHRFSGRRRLKMTDLEGERLIVAPRGAPHRRMIDQCLRRAGVDADIAVEANGWELMMHFVATGLGVAVVNDFCRTPSGTVAVPVVDTPTISFAIFTRESDGRDACEALVRLIAS